MRALRRHLPRAVETLWRPRKFDDRERLLHEMQRPAWGKAAPSVRSGVETVSDPDIRVRKAHYWCARLLYSQQQSGTPTCAVPPPQTSQQGKLCSRSDGNMGEGQALWS